jgi:hypothetical protein
MKFIMDSQEYELEISRDLEDEYNLLFSLRPNTDMNFFSRLNFGLKRLFGYRCKYGDFDCLTINEKDLKRIIVRLNSHEK